MAIITISTNPTDYTKYNINFEDLNTPLAHLNIRAAEPMLILIALPTDDTIPALCHDVVHMVETYPCRILGADKSEVPFKKVRALYEGSLPKEAIRMYSIKNYSVAKVVGMNDLS